jgi:peptidoglycan/LPS O-acetylase OafA/YrhL
VEEQFYIIWPLLLLFSPRQNLRNLFILFIILGPVFRIGMYLVYLSGSNLWVFREPFGLVIFSWPFSHVDAFALGAYISRYQIPNPRQQLLFLIPVVPALGFVTTYLASGNWGRISALGYNSSLDGLFQFIWAHSLLNYFFAVLIYCVVREKLLTRFLEMRWLRYLGKISYGMYVYHLPLIWFAERFFEERLQGGIALWIRAGVSLFATILIATLSYYLLEKPILNLKDRFFYWSPSAVEKNPG